MAPGGLIQPATAQVVAAQNDMAVQAAALQAQAAAMEGPAPPAAATTPPTEPPTTPPTEPPANPADPLLDRSHNCPGNVAFGGVGDVAMVNAKWNQPGDPAGAVSVQGATVIAQMKGRTYFAQSCNANKYDNNDYLDLKLLGRTMRYTVDLSSAHCGCNAALYLTSMRQHSDESMCFDHYCDASSVCSGTCAEVDLQEANNKAWFSTIHMSGDSQGLGGGYGFNRRDWNTTTYGPGARCIDTNRAFEVAVSFPVDAQGVLRAMDVKLTQGGSPCSVFSSTIADKYAFQGRQGKAEVSDALAAGMTPIISYWSMPGEDGMSWMDGPGPDQEVPGPCQVSEMEQCGDSVAFSNFMVE